MLNRLHAPETSLFVSSWQDEYGFSLNPVPQVVESHFEFDIRLEMEANSNADLLIEAMRFLVGRRPQKYKSMLIFSQKLSG